MAGDTKEAVVAFKLAFRAMAVACPADKAVPRAKGAAPTKKKQLFTQGQAKTKQIPVDVDGASGATFIIGANLAPDQERELVDFLRANKEVFAWEPKQLVLEICPRGNNKNGYYYISLFMIIVYCSCYNCINWKP